jgi:hypothetical protein
MPVAKDNMLVVMQWLASDVPGAPKVAEDLALLVFQGDMLWMNDTANADYYAETISAWVTGPAEAQFTELTQEGSESAPFMDWITPVIAEWRATASQEEAGAEGGLENPNFAGDPTPGTEFYKYDAASGTYLYSDDAGSDDWATYEQRRYDEPAFDDNYGLGYRYDKRDQVYEWLDEQNGTWNTQEWADEYARDRSKQLEATWDENWQMFYRIGPGGTYEYADPIMPGDAASGHKEEWLSYEQVMARDTATPAEPGGVIGEVLSELGANVSDLAQEADMSAAELAELASDPEFEQLVAEQVAKLLAGQDS